MPEHLRALVVILLLASCVFLFARRPICAQSMAAADFVRRRNLWLVLTLAAFLSHGFWIYILLAAAVLLYTLPREHNKPALFFMLLFLMPPLAAQITGLGVINHFFSMNHVRLLALVILLPAAMALWAKRVHPRLGSTVADRLVLGYLVLYFILQLSVDSFTNTLRGGFYSFIDVVLPYYVVSRSLDDLKKFREAAAAFVLAAMLLSALAVFEHAWHWLLYASLPDVLGVQSVLGGYLERNDDLRAQVTAGQPIPLGYVIAVALGLYGFLRRSVPNATSWWLGYFLLLAGLLAPISRGPWVGYAMIVVVFLLTSRGALGNFLKLAALSLVAVPLLLVTPAGEQLIDYLPFVGSVDEGNITYRQLLLKVSMEIIKENPLFGSYDFLLYLEELRQGQGIIDIVNTYLGVVLPTGLVGLTLFVSFFLSIAAGLYRALRRCEDKEGELYSLGQSLLATLLGILVIIFTVSSISYIPIVYWSVAGMGVACIRLLREQPSNCAQTSGDRVPESSRGRRHVPAVVLPQSLTSMPTQGRNA
jgi:O-antigen ligase